MTRRQRVNVALHSFMQLPPNDQRLLTEVVRRVAAGSPLEAALEAVTGAREVPVIWMPSLKAAGILGAITISRAISA